MSELTEMIPRGQALLRLVEASKEGAERFRAVGREAFRYGYAKDHSFDYQAWDVELSFMARVSATQQYLQTVGAFLYRQNPTWKVNAKRFANQRASMRAPVYQEYLNYVSREDHLYTEMRSILNDAMTYGRGCIWHGVHPTKTGVVTMTHDSVENLLCDPSATCWRDVGWVGRRRRIPQWRLASQYPRHKKAIFRLPTVSKKGDTQSEDEEDGSDIGTGLVEVHEIYMRHGLSNYRGGVKFEDKEAASDENPKKYVVTTTGKVLYAGPWDTPYYMDDDWPVTILDFHEHPTEPWPVSPLQPGLGWQRALNLVATQIVVKHRFASRNLYAILDSLGIDYNQEDMQTILSSAKPVEVLPIKIKGLIEAGKIPDIGHLIQRLETSANFREDIEVYNFVYDQFQKHTGLHEILHAGGTVTQLRTAQDASMKERLATNRIDDMGVRVEEFMHRLGRKTMITALFWMGPEDIAPILGPEAAMAWGSLMAPEELDVEFQAQRIMEELPPEAGQDPMIVQAIQAEAQEVVDSGYSLEQILRETDFDIEGGSLRRRTPEQETQMAVEANNQLVPTLLQIGAFGAAAPFIAKLAEAIGADRDMVEGVRQAIMALVPPPMPAPGAEGQDAPMAPQPPSQQLEMPVQ